VSIESLLFLEFSRAAVEGHSTALDCLVYTVSARAVIHGQHFFNITTPVFQAGSTMLPDRTYTASSVNISNNIINLTDLFPCLLDPRKYIVVRQRSGYEDFLLCEIYAEIRNTCESGQ